jgi:protein arginine kinase activator
MNCEICGSGDGKIKYTQMINGEKIEFYICEACAKKKGFHPGGGTEQGKPEEATMEDMEKERCPVCGWQLADIEKQGKLGCPQCYNTFRSYVAKLVTELHGESKHRGKAPVFDKRKLALKMKIREVRRELETAIKKEEYQLAAQLRDKIRNLSSKMEEDE